MTSKSGGRCSSQVDKNHRTSVCRPTTHFPMKPCASRSCAQAARFSAERQCHDNRTVADGEGQRRDVIV